LQTVTSQHNPTIQYHKNRHGIIALAVFLFYQLLSPICLPEKLYSPDWWSDEVEEGEMGQMGEMGEMGQT
jgi:hypothetical protein